MRLLILASIVWLSMLVPVCDMQAQGNPAQRKMGRVSFVTSQNVYVQFGNTHGIAAGDTVFLASSKEAIPVMIVKYLSSESCAGQIIGEPRLRIGDAVYSYPDMKPAEAVPKGARTPTPPATVSTPDTVDVQSPPLAAFPSGPQNRFYGGFSANSYSTFSNLTSLSAVQRWNYSLNFNGENILATKISFSSYMNYSYTGSQWKDIAASPFSNLRVYDLAAKYDAGDLDLWIGRHINRDLSGVGPIDGLQVQRSMGNFSFGGVIGSRPDFYNLSYNQRLFEYGAYIGRTDTIGNGLMQNTLGVFQQYNNMKTDRRFIYFQHTSNPLNDFSFFLTGQIDIFKLNNGKQLNDFSPTDLYFSMLYSPITRLSVSLSYSAERNTIYYETFGFSVDSLLLNQNELRHNLRIGLMMRPFNDTFVNIGGGYSFQQGDVTPTTNASIAATQSDIPLLALSATASYVMTRSSYLKGSAYGLRISKYMQFNSTTASLGYLRSNYNFGTASEALVQDQFTVDLSTRLVDNMFLNVYYQEIFSGNTTYGSFMGGFNYRF